MSVRVRVLLALALIVAVLTAAAVVESPADLIEAEGPCVESFTEGLEGAPSGIALGPDGNIWFVEQFESRVGIFDVATRTAREFQLVAEPHPHAVAAGPDGKLWYVAPTGQYGSFDPAAETFESFRQGIPPMGAPHSIVAAPDGFLYASIQEAGILFRIDPEDGTATPVSEGLPPVSRPHGIAVDPDGRHLWVALQNADEIARFDLATQSFEERIAFSDGSGPYEIAFGPVGMIYVTLQYASRLGRYDPATGETEEFELPLPIPRRGNDLLPGPKLSDLEPSQDGEAIWVTTFAASSLLRFDIETERVTRTTCGLVEDGSAYELITDEDGAVWVSQPLGHAIGRIED